MAALRWLRISRLFSTESKTSAVYGLDYSTDPARRAALERARDNDLVTALHTKLHEAKDGIRPLGVLVCVPVYVKGTSRDTIADRRRNLAGPIVGMFNLQQLLQSIRTTAATPAVSMNVYPPDARPEDRSIPDRAPGTAVDVGFRDGTALVRCSRDRQCQLAAAGLPPWPAAG